MPDAFADGFGVILFYRGSWCPYCNAQLRAFQRATDTLAELDVRVAALSVDDFPQLMADVRRDHESRG